MPCYLRRWEARKGREELLHQELVDAYQVYASGNPAVMESIIYREHFVGGEFISLIICDTEVDASTPEERALLAAFEKIAGAHAETITPTLRVETLHEFATIPQTGTYGMAALLRCRPERFAEVAERLGSIAANIVKRLSPSRLLVGHTPDERGHFLFVGDSSYKVDLDRYLESSLRQEHLAMLEPFLAGPTRWYVLDPVWRYFRGRSR